MVFENTIAVGNLYENVMLGVVIFSILFFVAVLFILADRKVFHIMFRGRRVYIFRGKTVVSAKAALVHKDDDTVLIFYSTVGDIIMNRPHIVHVRKDLFTRDAVYLVETPHHECRYVDLVFDDETAKIVYDDNEALAKEKFIKNMRLIASRFLLEDKSKKWINLFLVVVGVIGVLVLFSIINDTQIKIADKYMTAVSRQQEIEEKMANGTYFASVCKQMGSQQQQLPVGPSNIVIPAR